MKIDELFTLISAVCPVTSINSDGLIMFDSSATNSQKQSAQSVMDANLSKVNGVPDTPPADPAGFAQAVKVGIGGILAANALMAAYPAFFPAIQAQVWADVQALALDAKSKGAITAAQYNSIKGAAAQFNIPVAL